MPELYKVIERPIITEKALSLTGENKYAFVVHPDSNKFEIASAVVELFENSGDGDKKLTVVSVNTINVKGKSKSYRTFGRYTRGKSAGFKKAYVTLAAGQAITLFEGV